MPPQLPRPPPNLFHGDDAPVVNTPRISPMRAFKKHQLNELTKMAGQTLNSKGFKPSFLRWFNEPLKKSDFQAVGGGSELKSEEGRT